MKIILLALNILYDYNLFVLSQNFCSWVLEAMKLYLSIIKKSSNPIENFSPFEVRKLLIKVLTVKEWAADEE